MYEAEEEEDSFSLHLKSEHGNCADPRDCVRTASIASGGFILHYCRF
jgi:hypothetical protein